MLDTLLYLRHETSTWFEITTLLIPGENDSVQEITSLCRWIHENLGADIPVHFSAFHPDYRMQDRGNTPPETLQRARRIAMDEGLQYVYTGNVHDAEGGSTWCLGCGALLVERDWYALGTWHLDAQGCCRSCGMRVPGVFEEAPGDWGRKRQPVRFR